jgi:hypothetical protein
MLQVHYKWLPCPRSGATPIVPPTIRIATADEAAGSEHLVNVHQACSL